MFDTLQVVPTDIQLSGAEIELINFDNREYILRDILEKGNVREQYDFTIIDCPPSLNILTLNALTAADSVLFHFSVNSLPLKV